MEECKRRFPQPPPTSIHHFPFSRDEVRNGVFTPLHPNANRVKNIMPTDSQPPSREGGFLFFLKSVSNALVIHSPLSS